VGPKPVATPSLADRQDEFRALADRLWGTDRAKGLIDGGKTLSEALRGLPLEPDFSYARPRQDTSLLFVHRRIADGDIYWVGSENDRAEFLDATFRVQGKAPEIWHPDTGLIEPASYHIADGRTTVSLALDPRDAVFVVFRRAAAADALVLPARSETLLAAVTGAWDIAFQAGRGAPDKAGFEALGSWSDNADPGIKYFSGTATYAKTIQAPASWFKPGAAIWLDLGDVKNIAEVKVNGRSLGILWKAPFRVDATSALKAGANQLEIKVTNLWVNRLIGDKQPDAAKKITYTAVEFYRADSPLRPSGLLGPVKVVRIEQPED
ncbi:MAG: glycosylhydrolase-like jelly roll fold domain-containing protein, partial [Candidatus Aminicenantales bacterium]